MKQVLTVRVSRDNLDECRNALRSLEERKERMMEISENYPIACSFGDFQCVLTGADEIEELIKQLHLGLDGLEETSAKAPRASFYPVPLASH